MSSTPSQHVKRCPHMGHSQTKSQAPRLGVGKPGLWIWLLAGCLETPQTQGGGNWTWVLCFPDGFFLQVSRHSEHSFWFSPHLVGHPPAHSAWQRAQGLTASPSATLWLSATPWLVPPPPSCPGRGASPTRACPPPSLRRQSGISHRGLSVPTPPGPPPACFTVAPPCLPSGPWWPRSLAPRPWPMPVPLEDRPPPAITCLAPPQTSVETPWPSSQLRPCCLHPSLASAPSRGWDHTVLGDISAWLDQFPPCLLETAAP